MATTQEWSEQYWISSGGSTLKSSSCTATYHTSWKLSKLDEPDLWGNCWRSRKKLISDILPWTPSHGQAKEGWPARTYIQQLCVNTGCNLEDLLEAIDDREGWGISMLMAWHGDDDSNLTKIICIVIKSKLPSRLGLQNILTVSSLKGKTPPLSVLNMI